ncbi:filamentous hemagglutinin N-terminal domain-containing protein [Nostoc sp.]|uniref:filamentous hemagglutinin N-terminal domain-containing protein n=1 Tax=Nostoc sp. TaxID=1180 RepID=UPI002FF5B59B
MVLKNWLTQSCQLGLSSLLILSGLLQKEGGRTFAQVIADPSLGTQVKPIDDTTYEIRGGTEVGERNLFHSFNRFDVPDRGSANFINNPNIVNIFSRVTGGNPSVIQGWIRAQGNANLFLISPSGIIFGENAKLNIGGSFIGTTASAIRFPEGGEFSMTSPVNPLNPLLKVNPSAFIFNQIAEPIKSIQVNDANLSVPNSRSLLLLGGDVNLQGGELQATSGRVELGGLAGTGTVGLNTDNNNFRLSFPDNVARADVSLTKAATVTASGEGSGGIQVQGRRAKLTDDSRITVDGGNITLNLQELLLRDNSEISTSAGTQGASGNGGNITINVPKGSLINSPAVPVDTKVSQVCQARTAENQSSFTITGRGGLPPNPRSNEPLNSDAVQVDWVTLNPANEKPTSSTNVTTQATSPTPAPIVEAQGWVRNAKGEVVLTAYALTITPHSSWHKATNCRINS